jgi:aminoglycoside phosphotransferase (APT) family kinase protein
MESKTKNRKTREQIARMVEKAFGSKGITLADGEDAVRELEEGWFNAAYSIRLLDESEVILKIAPVKGADVLAYEKNIMATEVATMKLVRENPAIPVPEVYYFDRTGDSCDSDYMFMEKLAGDNYAHVRESFSAEMQKQIDRQIGAIVRQINGFTGTYFGYEGNRDLRGETWREAFTRSVDAVLEDGRRKGADFSYAIDDIREAVPKHAPSLEAVTTPRLVHWDAWDSNFFVHDGEVTGIIDFERALWADPLMEAQFRALSYGSGEVTEGMRGYGKTTFQHEEYERCYLYTLYLVLVMKTECYYRDYETDYVSDLSKSMMKSAMNWLKEN